MKLKHMRGSIWHVYAQIPNEHGEEDSYIPIIVRFKYLECDLLVQFIKAWTYGSPAERDELWLLRSWLEENESEIVAQIGGME